MIQHPPIMHVISLGAGVQSTTMALMAAHGEIDPMPDAAIFADTGAEPKAVYEHLDWLRSGNVLPFPVEVVQFSDLADDIRKTAAGVKPVAGRANDRDDRDRGGEARADDCRGGRPRQGPGRSARRGRGGGRAHRRALHPRGYARAHSRDARQGALGRRGAPGTTEPEGGRGRRGAQPCAARRRDRRFRQSRRQSGGAGGDRPGLYDLYAEFGIEAKTVAFGLDDDDTDVKGRCISVLRHIEDNLRGEFMTRVHALVAPEFFDALTSHPKVEKAYERWMEGAALRDDLRAGFTFGGITFEEYRGQATDPDGVVRRFIAENEGHAFPLGTVETFASYFAPADFNETANTLGQQLYAKQEPRKFERGTDLHTQSNPLPMKLKKRLNVAGAAGSWARRLPRLIRRQIRS